MTGAKTLWEQLHHVLGEAMLKSLTICFLLCFSTNTIVGQGTGTTAIWQEQTSLETTLHIYGGTGDYHEPDLFLRDGQYRLAFFTNYPFDRMDLRYTDRYGNWSNWFTRAVGGDAFERVYFYPPWDKPGAYKIAMRWHTGVGQGKSNNEYDAYIVPAADRMFTDTDGNYMVLWEGGSTGMDKPLLIVEGFDPSKPSNPSAENYPEFYYTRAEKFITKAHKYDTDVLILNFDDGGANILDNALVVQDAVNYITSLKFFGNDPVKLAGISMGGVVARYALAAAEENNLPLDVSHFVSLDAPQQGAVIDRKLQDFMKAKADDEELPLKSTAAKQMLVYNPYDNSGVMHRDFYSKLSNTNDNGYPELAKNIAVTFSTSNSTSPTGKWLHLQITILGVHSPGEYEEKSFYINTASEISQTGSYLPKSSTMLYGYSWPFIKWELERYLDPTYIPHKSALDIVDDSSMFDVTITPSSTGYHDEFPDEIVVPLLYELDLLPPLAASIIGPSIRKPGEAGTWVAAVSGGTSNYYPVTYRWEYKLTCPILDVIDEVQCGMWHYASSSSYFTRSGRPMYSPMNIKLTVTDTYSKLTRADSVTVTIIPDPPFVSLGENYPNPFNPTTFIRFSLPAARHVSLTVYDAAGRKVRSLADDTFMKGTHEVSFDASSLPSGLYFYTIRIDDYEETRSMMLLK